MRYLGIDYGTRKLGLALSDEAGTMGFPHAIIQNDVRTLDEVVRIVEQEGVGGIVIGESRNFKGEENPVAAEARTFAAALTERTGIAAVFEPEMLTTQEARRDFEGVHNAKSGDVDASAAALILTSYLSRTHD